MKFRNTLLLIIIVAVFLSLLFAINQEAPASVTQVTQVKKETKNVPVNNFIVTVSRENVCEGCHMSGKPFIPQALTVKPHIEGGAYCLTCHEITHEGHPVNKNITCEKCHGISATKPVFVDGSIACNNCHNYPDALLPSKGNLITIHKPRGIACNTCHTYECTKCHSEADRSERWEKRLAHFNTIVNMQ